MDSLRRELGAALQTKKVGGIWHYNPFDLVQIAQAFDRAGDNRRTPSLNEIKAVAFQIRQEKSSLRSPIIPQSIQKHPVKQGLTKS